MTCFKLISYSYYRERPNTILYHANIFKIEINMYINFRYIKAKYTDLIFSQRLVHFN